MKKTTKLLLLVTGIILCVILLFVGLYIIFGRKAKGETAQYDSENNLFIEEHADGLEETETDMFKKAGSDTSDNVADNAAEADVSETEKDPVAVTDMPVTGTYVERIEESYELWLTASVTTGLTFEYPGDLEIKDLYMASETDVEDHQTSKGIYLVFTSDGETLCVRSVPLEAERTEAETIDVYSEFIGYATFEIVSAEDIPADFYKQEISNDTLNTLIEQSVQVYLSYH